VQDFSYLKNSRGNPEKDLMQYRVPVTGSKVKKSLYRGVLNE